MAGAGARPRSSTVAPILGAANRLVDALRLGRPLSAAALIDAARQRTGLDDFGDDDVAEPLARLVQGYEEEACLSTFGRIAARWDMLRFLTNLLLLRRAETTTPALLEQPVAAPIFITGMPRSGTSFLHLLLGRDPGNRVVECWRTIFPCPARSDGADRRADKVERHLAVFARLAPELKRLHPMSARSPQECSEITAHVFRSLRFDTTHHVPSYRRWLDATGHLAAYRFHRRFLQHLQHGSGRARWVLKCPDHIFALDAVRTVYPDARFVFMHRDPVEVLASVARLTEILRRPFTSRLDRRAIGAQVSEHWARGTALLLAEAARTLRGDDRVFHLTFRRFVRDPLGCVGAVYRHFGMNLAPEVAIRLGDVIADLPDGGYGRNDYRLEDYGLDAAAERQRHREYIAYFGV